MLPLSNLKRLTLTLLLTPTLVFAANAPQYDTYRFLRNGINLTAFNACDSAVRKCSTENNMFNARCVRKTLRTSQCSQFKKLAEKIQGSPGLITAEDMTGKYTLITSHYLADGQESYYVVSPLGVLLKTSIDPRTVDNNLQQQYKNVDFLIKAAGKPTGEVNTTGARFTAPLTITKGCVACEVIAQTNVQYVFSNKGKLIKTSVVEFNAK